ncbi:MAG: hypothetical protein GXY86_13830 [Firmicutes bacterium]|nr:hypothetical protein [Bacillota bacterium]
MAASVVTCGNLEIVPFKLERLIEFKLTRRINEHERLYFSGVITEDYKDQQIHDISPETIIEVNQLDKDNQKTLLFKGLVGHLEIKTVRGIYYIQVEAVSVTQKLDVKLKSRSFQNQNMTYEDLIKQVVQEYKGDIIDGASQKEKIGKMIMQYQETDWQFLKRLASHFNAGLIPHALSDKPKLYFGAPEPQGGADNKLENFHYRVSKNLAEYQFSSENSIPDINETDFIYYEVEGDQNLNLGAEVKFNDLKLYVREALSILEGNIIKHRYFMSTQKGLSQPRIYNDQIVGLSIEGRVLEVAKDTVKVQLEIDAEQKVEEAWWFPYSSVYTAEGNSGWYCMPEIDDYVRIYFPTKKAEEAVAVNSARKDSDPGDNNKLDDPEIKYFRTKSGKELMFSPAEIIVTGKDNEIFLKLNDEEGIEIYSKKMVKIIAKEDLVMESEEANVLIKAKEGIDISCDASKIKLNKTKVAIEGNEIKTN